MSKNPSGKSRRGRPALATLNLSDIEEDTNVGDLAVTADKGVYVSSDGHRREEELLNISHKKRRLNPSKLNDRLAEWIPVPEDNFAQDEAEGRGPEEEFQEENVSQHGKRKEYTSSRDPMSLWRPVMGDFLAEILRHEGLGDDANAPRCALCRRGEDVRLFKCSDCGQYLQCETCCVELHQKTPLHVLKEWNGRFWEPRALLDLGLVYQLGHGGFPCPFPDTARKMVLIEAPAIHQIRFAYCKCSKSDSADNLEQLLRNGWYPATITDPGTCATFKTLEGYRLYNIVGNMNVRDYVTSLERMTDASAASGMTWIPERYKQFGRIARQWGFIGRLMRAGRGHDKAGVGATALGECAVRCWACPQEGRNLPDGWEEVDPKYQFLFMLILAVDANFRLRNRIRTNELDDPSLGPGWGYWVEPESYKEHLKNYVHEKEISTCIAFAALLQKDTRLTTGLRVSGVGGCVCARHECMRPNGLGDLQKGERYSNMDFIVMSALMGFGLLLLTISYDIACQWKINLKERMPAMPEKLRLPLDKIQVQYGLPVWHAGSHNDVCQHENSLSYRVGVGRTDGEGIERTWSRLNPAAYSTKDAGTGVRADALEAKVDNNNFLKNLGQGDTLQRRLVIAIAERDRQVSAFKEVSRTVEKGVKDEWRKMISNWLEDPSKPNPYVVSAKDYPTEAQVRLAVRKDEEALTESGKAPLHGRSATAFLVAGIQIEDAQRRILAQLKGTTLISAERENQVQEWRHALLVKISKFRSLQKIYMPGAVRCLEEMEVARDSELPPVVAERVKLFMPHEMSGDEVHDPLRGCVAGLVEMEVRLRVSQCENSLVSLRARLHAKRHLISFRDSNITGQVRSTKARTLIEQVGERVESYANRYRQGHKALEALKGPGAYPALRALRPEDVQLDGEAQESDSIARRKLGMLGSGRGARPPRTAPGTSKRVLSWIWTAPGALDDAMMHESVRVEWCRALARKTRWCEEVMLLREEMKRVLRYLSWQAGWWKEREVWREDVTAEVAGGLKAYAAKQGAWCERLAEFLRKKWDVPAVKVVQDLLAVEGVDQLYSLE
ncbi:CxC2 domain-containing protein [Favolaschia claudopus]|uniref:CxC2 domain-containing protein n=1 Tax=Favolaschia claudopus TaxID=2862362 RepID=A0AAW0AK48_9AGAR